MSPRCISASTKYSREDCEGMTADEVAWRTRRRRRCGRWTRSGTGTPGVAESDFDLISRIEPCIQRAESYTEPLLIVSRRRSFGARRGGSRASTVESAPGMETRQQNVGTRSTWTRAARGRSRGRSQPPARLRHGEITEDEVEARMSERRARAEAETARAAMRGLGRLERNETR